MKSHRCRWINNLLMVIFLLAGVRSLLLISYLGKQKVKSKKGYPIHFSPVFKIRLHDQDRVGEWGRARIIFSLLNFFFFLILCYFNFLQFFRYTETVGNRFTGNGILCLKAVKLAWRINSQLRYVIGCVDCQPTYFHSFFLPLFLVLVFLYLVCLVSLLRVVLFYPYVLVCYSHIVICYSYICTRVVF